LSVELHRIDAERNPVAVLRYAARRPRDVAIVVGHGYSSSKHNLDFLCSFLATHGFEIFSLDFPGHKLGASGGTLRGIDDCIDAMAATVAFARAQTRTTPYTLGHSMGAMTALLTAAADSTIPGVVAIATGYGRPTALTALMNRPGSDFRHSYVDGVGLPELTQSLDAHLDISLGRLKGRPQLYVAASRDAMVSQSSVRELFEHAPEPKTFETIESDHTYAGDNARGTILKWLDERHPRE
jgi:alpha-beta hydrolase superfamily lysophospholipase